MHHNLSAYKYLMAIFSLLEATVLTLTFLVQVSLFGEIVIAQKLLYEKCGNDLLIHLATKVLPAVHCPPNLAEQFCLHIQV